MVPNDPRDSPPDLDDPTQEHACHPGALRTVARDVCSLALEAVLSTDAPNEDMVRRLNSACSKDTSERRPLVHHIDELDIDAWDLHEVAEEADRHRSGTSVQQNPLSPPSVATRSTFTRRRHSFFIVAQHLSFSLHL